MHVLATLCIALQLMAPARTLDGRVVDPAGLPIRDASVAVSSSTVQVTTAIDEILKPRGVAVMIEAEHMCMSLRGVEKPGALTVTTHFTGAFRDDPAEQVRFMTMLRGAQR